MYNGKAKGYVFAAVAAATYGTNPLFALPLYSAGMDANSVLFFRYLLAVPILGIMLKLRGHDLRLKRNLIFPVFVLGLLVALSSLALFESYNYMEAGIASTILFVYPVMVAVIMALFFHERITRATAMSIILALAGIVLLYKGGDGVSLSFVGTCIVLISALTYALYIVGVNRPAFKEVPTLKITFYVLLFGVLVFVGKFIAGSELVLPPSENWYLWGNVLGLAIFPTAVSFICTTTAVQYIGSTPTAILGALEPLTAIFFGVTVFGEQLTVRETIGIVLIITAVTAVVAGGSLSKPLLRLRKMFPSRRGQAK